MHKPDCYECKHRGTVLGSHHSRCKHPSLEPLMEHSVYQILALLGTVGRGMPVEISTELNVTGSEHGIKNGWFAWPFNFDPLWLEECDGWEEKE